MRKDLFGAARALVVPTLALVGVAIFAPGRGELAVRIYALVVCATAIVLLLLALRRAYPRETPLREAEAPIPRRSAPPSLVRLEHATALGVAGSFDVHYRLVPRLRTIASGLLAARRNVSLGASPVTARAILGEDAWELVRPDRPAPENRLARGVEVDSLERAVDALEGV